MNAESGAMTQKAQQTWTTPNSVQGVREGFSEEVTCGQVGGADVGRAAWTGKLHWGERHVVPARRTRCAWGTRAMARSAQGRARGASGAGQRVLEFIGRTVGGLVEPGSASRGPSRCRPRLQVFFLQASNQADTLG